MIYVTGDLHGEEERLYSRSMKSFGRAILLLSAATSDFVGRKRQRKENP